MDFFVHPPVRAYKMPDAKLTQKSDGIVQSATRDLAELADYGVSPAALAAITAKRDEFAYLPTDYMLSGLMMMATQAKNDKHKQLETGIRRIADRVRLKYGVGHGMYTALGVAMLSRQTSDELVRTGRSVVLVGTQFLAELASEGVTAPLLAEITTMSDELDDLIDAKLAAVQNRDLAVFNRITIGNELYAMLVNLAGKGKSCWYGVNEAKHNDYVIYSSGESSNTQQIEGNIDAEMVVNTSVNITDENTVITMRNTGAAPLRFFFAVNPTDTSGAQEVVVAPSESISRTAAALGYNPQTVRFNVYNPEAVGGSYTVEW